MNSNPVNFIEQQQNVHQWCLQTDALIDGMGHVIYQPVIHIQDDRIVRITSGKGLSDGESPCLVIPNSTALPGLIDCHFHALGDPICSLNPWSKKPREVLLSASSGMLKQALLEGITSVYDCGAPKRIMVEIKRAIEEHIVSGPQVLTCNQVLYKGKHSANGLGLGVEIFENLKARLGAAMSGGADFINVHLHGANIRKQNCWDCQFDLTELREIVHISHSYAKKVMVQCHTLEAVNLAMAAAVDIIELASPYALISSDFDRITNHWDRCAEIVLIPSLTQVFEEDWICPPEMDQERESLEHIRYEFIENLTWFLQQGARIGAGSNEHSFHENYVSLKREIQHLATLIGSNMKAITIATGDAARLLDLDDLGILGVGKKANLLIVEANPLDDLSALNDVSLVVKDGRIVENNIEKDERRPRNLKKSSCEVNPIYIHPSREEKRCLKKC